MTITRDFCSQQLARLSGLPGYPKAVEGLRTLVDAMEEAFPNTETLRRWVDDLIQSSERCPLPRDVYIAGRAITPSKSTTDYKCTICYDSGLAYAEFLVTWHEGGRKTSARLTAEQAAELWEKHRSAQAEADALTRAGKPAEGRAVREARCLQLGTQMIYERSVPCTCRLPGPPVQLPLGA